MLRFAVTGKCEIMSHRGFLRMNTTALKRAIIVGLLDIISVGLSFCMALWLRFDFTVSAIPQQFLDGLGYSLPFMAVVYVLIFIIFNLYNSIWVFVSTDEVFKILGAYGVLAVFTYVFTLVTPVFMPRSYYILGFILSFFSTLIIRFSYRLLRQLRNHFFRYGKKGQENVMIIGAGEAGRTLLKDRKSVV